MDATHQQPRAGIDIFPQPGPQMRFLTSSADIAVFGGAAGSGKSWALLIEALRHPPAVMGFDAVMFRRTTVDIRKPGGLWAESLKLFPYAGGLPVSHTLEWRWPGYGSIKMAHLEHDTTVYDWHGAQVPLICFDELQTFTMAQFFYMLSRNRSATRIPSRIRATCNADASSWLAEFLQWYWHKETGYPIAERSGVIRYFVRGPDDTFLWFNSRQQAVRDTGYPPDAIKSFTFIAAKLEDNPALMRADPQYLGNLMMLPQVERERLLNGNWKIVPAAGAYFNRSWCQVVDIAPVCVKTVRGWDLASSEQEDHTDPDWTACTKIGLTHDGRYIILHADAFRESPAGVDRRIMNYASSDGYTNTTSIPQDPGQAGKAQVLALTRMLAGYIVDSSPESGDKVTRFGPFSSQCEAGNVLILRGPWNERFFTQLENFPQGSHDDDADATSRAFHAIAQQPPMRFDPDELRKLGVHLPPEIGGIPVPPGWR